MKKRNETIRMLVLSAMFAALCCVTTMLVQFPTVAGYTNIGEGMCLLAGLVLGPWYGFFAAGIGSGLADLLAGYAHYVPGTFIIKGLVALVAALLLQPMLKKGEKIPFWHLALIELPSEVIMVAGYFGYKALILGKGLAAAASRSPFACQSKRSARPTSSAPARARNTSAAPERFIRTCKHEKLLLPTARGAFDICRELAKILGEFWCAFLWGFVGFPCFDTEFSFHHDGNVL